MLVRDVMTSPAVVISPDTTLEDAYRVLHERQIRHLLVVEQTLEQTHLVGVVTDRDLRLATSTFTLSPHLRASRIADVMCRNPLTAHPSDPIEDAAFRMRERKIGCLPVMEDGAVVGIITGIDLLDALLRMTGVDKPSGRLEVRLPDQPGELARLTSFLSHRDVNIHSILSHPEGQWLRTVLRVGSIETRALAHDLREDGFEVVWPAEKPWPR